MATTVSLDLFVSAHTTFGAAGIGLRGTLSMGGTNYVAENQIIGTSAEAVSVGDVTGAAALQFYRNTDATNYVTLYADGATGTVVAAKLLPGQWALFWGGATPAIGAKANTAACELQKVVLENVTITSLTAYRPKAPELGKLVAGLKLQAVFDGLGLNLDREYTEDAVAAALLPVSVAESSQSVFPSGAGASGGTGYGTLVLLNPDATDTGTIYGSDSLGDGFARMYAANGFAVLPINGTSLPFTAADGIHDEARLITRKTL